ncbi:MAG: FMN-binding negative transcriptional regulator [Burkholderiales bacterium]
MYLPAHFSETRFEVLRELVQAHPLGVLVTFGAEGLNANHLPFEWDPEPAPFGTLRAHVARANSLWKELSSGTQPLAIFQGPQHYITPSWYQTKKDTGKVVPTWNYLVVHAYGPMWVIDDPQWLRKFVGALTDRFEAPRAQPWKVEDAPEDFIATQLKAIVGIEMTVEKLLGKWKASQNRPAQDRDGVVAGLREYRDADAKLIAEAVGKDKT